MELPCRFFEIGSPGPVIQQNVEKDKARNDYEQLKA
jgi:hypothetical protein